MYFAILCYYLIFNVFKRIKWMRALVGCFIGFLSLIYLLILIDSFIQNVQTCKCILFLFILRVILPHHEFGRCFYQYRYVCSLQVQWTYWEKKNLKAKQNARQWINSNQRQARLKSHQDEDSLESRFQSTFQTHVVYDHMQHHLPGHRFSRKPCI